MVYYIGAATPNLKLTPEQQQLVNRYFQNKDWVLFFMRNGIPAQIVYFLLAQVQHETADFKDKKIQTNNYSGIMHKGKYANYPSKEAWIKEMLGLLKKDAGAGRPIDAKSLAEYATRLKRNGYYADTYNNYLNGLLRFNNMNLNAYNYAWSVYNNMRNDANKKDIWYYLATRALMSYSKSALVSLPNNLGFDLLLAPVRAVKDYNAGSDNMKIESADGSWKADNAAVQKENEKQTSWQWNWNGKWGTKEYFLAITLGLVTLSVVKKI